MSLLDDARELGSTSFVRCPVALLDDELRTEVEEAILQIDGRTVTAKALSLALRKRGAQVSDQALRRHIRGDCCCEPC